MRKLAAGLCMAVACAAACAFDKEAEFDRVYRELEIDKTVLAVDPEGLGDQPGVYGPIEATLGRKLTDAEKAQLNKAVAASMAASPKPDLAQVRKVFREKMFKYLSDEDMKAAADLLATPQGKRMRW